ELERAIEAGKAELDALTQRIVSAGLASWSGGSGEDRKLIVRGQAHLLEDLKAAEDLERVRLLFDDLETKRDVIDLLGPAERPAETPAAEPEGATPSTPADEKTEEARIAELVETLARESADYKDKHLRALAEMENMRKRTERQIADMRHYGIAAFANDVLAVADNMHRALEAAGPELRN